MATNTDEYFENVHNTNNIYAPSAFREKVIQAIDKLRKNHKRPDIDSILDWVMKTEASNVDRDLIESIIVELMNDKIIVNKKTTKGCDSFFKSDHIFSKNEDIYCNTTEIAETGEMPTNLNLRTPDIPKSMSFNTTHNGNETELLKEQLKSKDLIIDILHEQLKVLQKVTENLSATIIYQQDTLTNKSNRIVETKENIPAPNKDFISPKRTAKANPTKKQDKYHSVVPTSNHFESLQNESYDTIGNENEIQDTTQIKNAESNNGNKENNKRKGKKKRWNNKRLAIMIGDSITKDTKPWEMKKKVKNPYIINQVFNGATIDDMVDYVKPSIRNEAIVYILYSGKMI